jgi:DNA-binding CsgD family transcriptional regulator/tetratricopeptide (TPR) repeat protein
VAGAIDELEARYFIEPAAVAGSFDFRHALIRDALEGAIPRSRRRAMHERVARYVAIHAGLADDAFLSAHFEAAGLRDEAYPLARAAAASAASLSAHREALDLARRAVRCAPAALPTAERALLLADVAAEEAATDDNEAAAATYAGARRMLLAAGRSLAATALLPPLVATRHLLGDPLERRVETLASGFDALDGDTTAEGTRLRGLLAAGIAAAYMLDRRLDEAAEHGQRAIDIAAAAQDEATELNAMSTLGSVLVFAGRMDDGWSRLEESVSRARSGRLEAEAARAYRMMGSCASVLVEYDRAEHWLRDGIDYAERTEQWNHRHYMAAHLGHVRWAIGAWDDAATITQHALADGRGGITTRITALHVLGYLALGRGDWASAEATLGEARTLGEEMGELQRSSPAVWGLAEAAHLQGRHGDAVDLTDAGYHASAAVSDGAYLFPYLVTGTRARLALGDPGRAERWCDEVSAALRDRSIPGTLPAIDHAQGLVALARGATGRARTALKAARAGWLERHRAWEGCAATIELARCSLRANRPGEAATLVAEAVVSAERMGAEPLLARARALETTLRRRGVAQERWAPLTAREFEVASLIAAGRTNREIAAELTITPKTVASHVEHILARLGAERRTEIATWVASVRSG